MIEWYIPEILVPGRGEGRSPPQPAGYSRGTVWSSRAGSPAAAWCSPAAAWCSLAAALCSPAAACRSPEVWGSPWAGDGRKQTIAGGIVGLKQQAYELEHFMRRERLKSKYFT